MSFESAPIFCILLWILFYGLFCSFSSLSFKELFSLFRHCFSVGLLVRKGVLFWGGDGSGEVFTVIDL